MLSIVCVKFLNTNIADILSIKLYLFNIGLCSNKNIGTHITVLFADNVEYERDGKMEEDVVRNWPQ